MFRVCTTQNTENSVDSVVNAAAEVGQKGGSIAVKVSLCTIEPMHGDADPHIPLPLPSRLRCSPFDECVLAPPGYEEHPRPSL